MTTTLARICASNPVGVILYNTIELRHPELIAEDGSTGAIRLVDALNVPLEATLETGALAAFRPFPFTFTRGSSADQRPSISYQLDGASREITEQLERIANADSLEKLQIIPRTYSSEDLSAPLEPAPFAYTVKDPDVTETSVKFTAEFVDAVNKAFPAVLYTQASHPALYK